MVHFFESFSNITFISVILERPIRFPRSLSVKAASILKSFLNKNPMDRLGCHPETGFTDIITHPFFKTIDWEMVRSRFLSIKFVSIINSSF